MAKILVALSGGVDSALSALLLKNEGHEVSGAYLKTWQNEYGQHLFDNCPWEEDIESAKSVCEHLQIDFEVIPAIEPYRKEVVDPLIKGYAMGITPNPDVHCNRAIKFGFFYEWAKQKNFEGIATGHYVRKAQQTDNSFNILEGFDKTKDQSYFLVFINQSVLKNTYFPLGNLEKKWVRTFAQKNNLPNANRKDSQGICFLGKVNMQSFLKQFLKRNPREDYSPKRRSYFRETHWATVFYNGTTYRAWNS